MEMKIENGKFNFSFSAFSFPLIYRGMVSMVSMEVSKTLGPGSSPGTPASHMISTN
jgi:hypothetical protein